MNPRIQHLQDYPFARLAQLLTDCVPNPDLDPITLGLGEPKHSPPDFIIERLSDAQLLTEDLAKYPATKGSEALRGAISQWLKHRFDARLSAEHQILPVNGTREALFSFAQACLSGQPNLVMMPNPFYQIYEGAALLAGAQPYFVNNDHSAGYQQNFADISPQDWARTELVYLCSPGNPTGQVMPLSQMCTLIEKAHEHDFIIAADECYSEIYSVDVTPPHSLLNACLHMGNDAFSRCVVFHSLSKRSNLPGLRSGFVAGDADLIGDYFQYRTYHGCAMSAHHQAASTLAWEDEAHVRANLALYQAKFAAVEGVLAPHLPLNTPAGGFYHWIRTPIEDTEFCRQLYQQQSITVLPGQYLARPVDDTNPGHQHVRVAWVSPLDQCHTAATRIADFMQSIA